MPRMFEIFEIDDFRVLDIFETMSKYTISKILNIQRLRCKSQTWNTMMKRQNLLVSFRWIISQHKISTFCGGGVAALCIVFLYVLLMRSV